MCLELLALGGAGILSILLFMKDTYWYQRMTSFVDPFQDPLGEGYQAVQSLLALGSGGLFGVGLGKSVQKNLYLPEPQNDFILANHRRRTRVYRDRIGSGTVLLFFVAWRPCGDQCSGPVRHAPGFRDRADGWNTSYFKYCGRNTSMPPTGINLPFISYGGNALLMFMFSAGVLLNISRHAPKNTGVE